MTTTDQSTDRHVVYAVTDADEKIRVGYAHPWQSAQARWNVLDTARLRGNLPGIKYLAIRHADDPQWNTARRARDDEVQVLRPTKTRSAEAATRAWAADHGYEGRGGGWVYGPGGKPFCQGWSGLTAVLVRRCAIVKRGDIWWIETSVEMPLEP